MNRTTRLAAIVFVLAPATAFAQMGGMGGMGGGMGRMDGQGIGVVRMMGTGMMAAAPTEVRRTAQVEMEGGHRLTGRMDIQPLVVHSDLGFYSIRPDKIKMIRFLKPVKDQNAADVGGVAGAADPEEGGMNPAMMIRAQQLAARGMIGFQPNAVSAPRPRGKVVTTSGQEIIGIIDIPMGFRLEFEFGSLRLEPSKLRSVTFLVPDPKAGAVGVGAASTGTVAEAAGEAPAPPRYFRHEHSVIVVSPVGDRATFHDFETGRSQSVELTGSKDAPIQVTPMLGPDLVALALDGSKIHRVAVADLASGTWHPQDLREPVEGRVRPVVAAGLAVYHLGRYVYAYSAAAGRWDVAELPEDLRGRTTVEPGGATVEGHGQIYTFLPATGRWQHVDVRAILNGAGPGGKK